MANILESQKRDVVVDHSKLAERIGNYDAVVTSAETADREEHSMTMLQALRTHKKAAAWSAFLSLALVMEGYDLVIINSFYGQPQFRQKYGTLGPDGKYIITAPWQTGLSNAALCGQLIGLAINGYTSQRFGYRKTMMAALCFMTAAIFAVFFAPNLPVLTVGEVLCGIPWGVFQTLSTAYAADVCPLSLRPLLTTYVNMCWGFGILISSGVARGTLQMEGAIAYKLPFALQWIWPVPLLMGAFLAPESPWWLVRQGRREDALESVRRLTDSSHYTFERAQQQVDLMEHTNALEKAEVEGVTYLDCFRGTNLRRTEIACAIWAIQWWCGNPLIGFAVTFLQQAGLDDNGAYNFNLGMNTMYFVGTVCSWFLLARIGRRDLQLFGLVFMGVVCTAIAVAGFTKTPLAVGVLLIILNFAYNISIGPVCYCIVAEISSTRLRPMTVVLARMSYNLTGIVTNTITPRMIQATAWGWGARCGLFWLGTCTLAFIYCFFRLPETRYRTYGELDILFEEHVTARKFKRTNVQQFGSRSHEEQIERSTSEKGDLDEKVGQDAEKTNTVTVRTGSPHHSG